MYIPKENQNKLDEKLIKCIFLVYSNQYKACRCYDSIINKMYINKDVIFNEGRSYMKKIDRLVIIPNFEDSSSNDPIFPL